MSPPESRPTTGRYRWHGLPADDTYRDRKNGFRLPARQKARILWKKPQASGWNPAMKPDYVRLP